MIQCETCGCWQHGVCVGLVDEKYAPDTYFCELCRPDMHPIIPPKLVHFFFKIVIYIYVIIFIVGLVENLQGTFNSKNNRHNNNNVNLQ